MGATWAEHLLGLASSCSLLGHFTHGASNHHSPWALFVIRRGLALIAYRVSQQPPINVLQTLAFIREPWFLHPGQKRDDEFVHESGEGDSGILG